MKILNIMQGTDLGGMEQASLRLMLGLKELGHSVEVLSLNPIGGLGYLLEKHGIPAKGLPYRGKGGWRSYFPLKQALDDIRADALIMTGHHLLSMMALGNLCIGRRVLAQHFHHSGVKPNWQWRLIYWLACKRFQAITFPSDFVRLEAEAIYPPIKYLSHTVRNPLKIPPLPGLDDRLDARRVFGMQENALVVGNAGWLIPRKRFDVFLRVAQKVIKKMPNAFFLIAGDGEERLHLESLATDLGITDHVKWLGWQKDLSQFYKCLDVILFNSDWDALPTTPLEAMAYGIPLVASLNHGGLKEIINNEDYGFLIATHDIDILADRIVYLFSHPSEAGQLALSGRKRIEEVSDTDHIVHKMTSLLALMEV
jgi:glycosyltransferase involved in cell wall biosynthesis